MSDEQRLGGAGRQYEARRRNRLRRDPHSVPPQHEEAWRKGEEGEQRVAAVLNAHVREHGGAAALHDLTKPGRRANIDHVVIGPAGITVIDTKAWSGAVTVRQGVLRCGGWSKDGALHGLADQVAAVRAAIDGDRRFGGVPVRGALCLANDHPGVTDGDASVVGGMAVGGAAAIAGLALGPGALGSRDVRLLEQCLGSRLATGRAGVGAGGSALAPCAARPRRPGRRGRRSRGSLPGLLVRLVLLAVFVAGAPSAFSAWTDAVTPTPSVARERAEWRSLAEARAGGPVEGPRVVRRASRKTLIFRRAPGCVVRVTVRADPAARAGRVPRVTSIGCGAQPTR